MFLSSKFGAASISSNDFKLYINFVDYSEEVILLKEIDQFLKNVRYETDHWDDAIIAYREIEKKHWNLVNKNIMQRIRKIAFEDFTNINDHIHVLDLASNGYIKPHIDSIKFCGNTVAVLSLNSSSILRMSDQTHLECVILPPRSLYIMKNDVRYKWTHEILPDNSTFKNIVINKLRRISVVMRNLPK